MKPQNTAFFNTSLYTEIEKLLFIQSRVQYMGLCKHGASAELLQIGSLFEACSHRYNLNILYNWAVLNPSL